MKKDVTAIVLSAGRGRRMGSEIPKQYLKIKDHEVLYYSLKAFEESSVSRIILVTGKEDIDAVREGIVEKNGFQKVTDVIAGGAERYDSVYQGLLTAGEASLILIHDGARPMVTPKIIEDVIDASERFGNCTSAVPVKDTIKVADENGFAKATPDRNTLWAIHTPQGFRGDVIRRTHEALRMDPEPGVITDDTMLVEKYLGIPAKMVEGSYQNIKVTTPDDILLAECFLTGKTE